MIRFLQLIVLSFTALIYIGQSFLRSDVTDSGRNRTSILPSNKVIQSVKLLGLGAIFMVLSGVIISIYLIPALTFERVAILNFWLSTVFVLSPWEVPPVLPLILFTVLITLILQRQPFRDNYYSDLVLVGLIFLWLYSAASSAVAYINWIPFIGISSFALGMSLFLVGILRLALDFTDEQVLQ